MDIITWNAQGGAKENAVKKAVLDGISTARPGAVILLQEGGTRDTGYSVGDQLTMHDCIARVEDIVATVTRCTVNIFKQRGAATEAYIIRPTTNSRPACYTLLVTPAGLRIGVATIHATANSAESISEIKSTIAEFDKKRDDGVLHHWVLAGDFNSSPDDYIKSEASDPVRGAGGNGYSRLVAYGGTKGSGYKYCMMLYTGVNTQGPGGRREKELDFAFADGGITNTFRNFEVIKHAQTTSDHDPVHIVLT